VIPVLLTYVLSFVYIGIYWNNHHHLLHATQRVSGPTLWANLHLLFWLSLVPFTTAWMGENHFDSWPTALYGIVLLSAGVACFILTRALINLHGSRLNAGNVDRTRQKRENFHSYLRRSNSACIHETMDSQYRLRNRCHHLAVA
jgi:uncharacterized membrane protein